MGEEGLEVGDGMANQKRLLPQDQGLDWKFQGTEPFSSWHTHQTPSLVSIFLVRKYIPIKFPFINLEDGELGPKPGCKGKPTTATTSHSEGGTKETIQYFPFVTRAVADSHHCKRLYRFRLALHVDSVDCNESGKMP